jgi:hypothetical protein
MARIRTIKPEFWASEALSLLPEATHMLAAALLNYADDEGYFNANPELIRASCFPLREPSVKVPVILQQLQECGYLRLGFAKDGRRYGHIVNFLKHQKVSHPTESKIKTYDIVWDDSVSPHGVLTEDSGLNRIELKGIEGKRNLSLGRVRGKRKKFAPPSVDQVTDYCRERANGINANTFIDFYASRGWMSGKTKITDWKACVRTWEQNRKSDQPIACQPLTAQEIADLGGSVE